MTPHTLRQITVGALALAASFAAAACSDTPSAPRATRAPAHATAIIAGTALQPGAAPRLTMTKAQEDSLKKVLESEKLRIARAQEASKATYDSLKLEWERLNKTYPSGNPSLLYCDPLQYAAVTKIVGPAGETLDFGPHKLVIPQGALATYTVITAEAPVSLSVWAKFSPHGLVFVASPKLTLSYKHCNRPTKFTESIGYVVNGQVVERPTSSDRTFEGLVDAWIRHFSGYNVVVD